MTTMQTVKGTRDISGKDAVLRSKVINILKNTFEKYGFQPFFTPALEYSETLKTKISEEMLGLIYEFKDKADRDIGLRYDLTLGLARFASSTQIQLPFKRYQIERAWRYEKPQSGRYREFWQADIDILGIESAKAEAECLACISEALKAIGINNFIIRINSRKLLDKIAQNSGLQEKEKLKAFQIIDKIDKIGEKEVQKELTIILGKAKADKFFKAINTKEKTDDIKELEKFSKAYRIKIQFDPTLVRGLAYYTGLVFEIVSEENKNKQSIAGGGRYDDLIEKFGGRKIPATGISIGLDRVCEILKIKEQQNTVTKVYIIPISEEQEDYAISVLQELRSKNISADISFSKPGKALEYANKQGIPYTIFIGKEEKASKKVKLKDMKTGKETLLSLSDAVKMLKG